MQELAEKPSRGMEAESRIGGDSSTHQYTYAVVLLRGIISTFLPGIDDDLTTFSQRNLSQRSEGMLEPLTPAAFAARGSQWIDHNKRCSLGGHYHTLKSQTVGLLVSPSH